MDLLLFNGMPFLHTKPGNINFLSVQYFKKRTKSDIIDGLSTVK